MTRKHLTRLEKLLYFFNFLVWINIGLVFILYLVDILPNDITVIMYLIYTALQLYVIYNYDKMII